MDRPLYNQLVSYYELLEGRDWEHEVGLVSSVMKEHSCRSVIDLGCGTGLHVRELAKAGFDATGIDISVQNVKYARERAAEDRVGARYVRGSYFDYRPRKKFDSAICLNWSIPVRDDQIRKFLDNTSSLLRVGGLLIFDYEKISEIVWDDVGKPDVESWKRGSEVIVRVSLGRLESNVLRSDDIYLIFPKLLAGTPPDELARYQAIPQNRQVREPQNRQVRVYVDRSFVRFFSPSELDRFARESGFSKKANLVLPRKKYRRNYLVLAKL